MESAFRQPRRKQTIQVIAVEDDEADKDMIASLGIVEATPVSLKHKHKRKLPTTEKHASYLPRSLKEPQQQFRRTTIQESKVNESLPTATAASSVLWPSTSLDQLNRTEHRWVGTGIVANRRDLEMPSKEFANGCLFLQAAGRGDIVAMRSILAKQSISADFRDYDRRTALHVAASEGQLGVCQFLIEECKARVNRSDRWGGSPLDDAQRHRFHDVTLYLRTKGATTGTGNRLDNFLKAAAEGDLEEVKLVVETVKKRTDRKKKVEDVAVQMKKRHPSASVFDLNEGDYDSRTGLHLAAGNGHLAIVRVLCVAGVDVNAEDRWKRTPLDDAIRHGHADCQLILEEYGAHVGKESMVFMERSQDVSDSWKDRQHDNLQVKFEELDVIERIGSGAFGEIYKCRWRGVLVASKIIKTAKIRDLWMNKRTVVPVAKTRKRVDESSKEMDAVDVYIAGYEVENDRDAKEILEDFHKEISLLKGLRHPNIVLLLAYSTTEDYECLISELMKCSLHDIFKSHWINGTRVKVRTAFSYARQLSQGMAYLHSCHIIHRDLKPANLLIDHSGMLKISDFGLSRVRPDPTKQEADSYYMTGETGSYRFMAPEVFLHKDYNETVDIYSYAMIMYYLFIGQPPWKRLSGMEVVRRAATGERPTVPRLIDERLLVVQNRLLQDIITTCWHEDPGQRTPFMNLTSLWTAFTKEVFHEDENHVHVARDDSLGCGCVIS